MSGATGNVNQGQGVNNAWLSDNAKFYIKVGIVVALATLAAVGLAFAEINGGLVSSALIALYNMALAYPMIAGGIAVSVAVALAALGIGIAVYKHLHPATETPRQLEVKDLQTAHKALADATAALEQAEVDAGKAANGKDAKSTEGQALKKASDDLQAHRQAVQAAHDKAIRAEALANKLIPEAKTLAGDTQEAARKAQENFDKAPKTVKNGSKDEPNPDIQDGGSLKAALDDANRAYKDAKDALKALDDELVALLTPAKK